MWQKAQLPVALFLYPLNSCWNLIKSFLEDFKGKTDIKKVNIKLFFWKIRLISPKCIRNIFQGVQTHSIFFKSFAFHYHIFQKTPQTEIFKYYDQNNLFWLYFMECFMGTGVFFSIKKILHLSTGLLSF